MAPVRMPSGALGSSTGDARGVGAEIAGSARHGGNGIRHRHEQVDVRGDSTSEGLRRDGEACTGETQALSLDRLMLDELVGCGFNDQRVTEFAALDDRRRGRSRNDGVVVWAGNGLIDAALDEEARRDDVDRFAHRVGDGLYLRTAVRADPQIVWDRVGYVHARHVGRKRAAPAATAPLFLIARRVRVRVGVFSSRPATRSSPLAGARAGARAARAFQNAGACASDEPHAW